MIEIVHWNANRKFAHFRITIIQGYVYQTISHSLIRNFDIFLGKYRKLKAVYKTNHTFLQKNGDVFFDESNVRTNILSMYII